MLKPCVCVCVCTSLLNIPIHLEPCRETPKHMMLSNVEDSSHVSARFETSPLHFGPTLSSQTSLPDVYLESP